MEDMNESKKKGIEPRFTNKLTSLIKTVDETPNENAYKDILAKMASDQSMISHGFHIYKETGESAYANNTVDEDGGYTSFRVSNHFPIMANIIDKVPDGYPSKRQYAHMCILLLGHYELLNMSQSAQGQYALGRDGSRIIIKDKKTFERVKNFYSDGSTFPFRFYHYIPNLMTYPNDVDSIINASVEWFNGSGNKEFNYIELSDPNARPSKECMYVEIRFVINPGKITEDVSNVIVSGKKPVMTFVIDRKQYVLRSETFDVDVYIDIYDCAAYMVEYMNQVAEECNRLFKRSNAIVRKNKKK